MDFMELIKKRYSVRKFQDRIVENEKIQMILEAGRLAPTACNNQPQRILILNSKEALGKIKLCTLYTFDAPLFMIICFDKNVSWKRQSDHEEMGNVDASIVATHMMLEISNLGLGSTWVGQFDSEKIRVLFSLPKNYVPIVILPIGYPAETCMPHANHCKRLGIESTSFYNVYATCNNYDYSGNSKS